VPVERWALLQPVVMQGLRAQGDIALHPQSWVVRRAPLSCCCARSRPKHAARFRSNPPAWKRGRTGTFQPSSRTAGSVPGPELPFVLPQGLLASSRETHAKAVVSNVHACAYTKGPGAPVRATYSQRGRALGVACGARVNCLRKQCLGQNGYRSSVMKQTLRVTTYKLQLLYLR